MFPNQQRNHEENDENKIDLQQFTLNYLYSTRKLNQSLLGLNNLFYLPQIASLQHDVGNVNVLNQIQSPHNNQISIYKQHSNPHLNYQHQQHQVFNYKQNPTITFGSQLEPPLRVSERTSNQASYVQSRSIFKNRTIDDYRQLNEFQKAYDETKAALRIVPRHQDLNYLNCPFPDINHPYHPLDHFNYAVPQKIEVFEQCQPVNSHDYDRMREDFENNGKDADWTSEEIAERRGSTLLSVNILEDFHFPPLDLPSEHKSSQIWKIQYEAPILPVNSNVDTSLVIVPSDNEAVLKKKQLKPNRKSLENHCVFCKNNGADESVYQSHTLKDSVGRTICPILRRYKCPICGADGDSAHTTHYCPEKKIVTMEEVNSQAQNQQTKKQFQYR